MDGDDGPLSGVPCVWNRYFVGVHGSHAGCSGLSFLGINAHALTYATFNVRPFLAGAFHATTNGHGAFLFSFTEIINQTHSLFPFMPGRVLAHQGH